MAYGIPQDNTDDTARAGRLAPSVNLLSVAVDDLDERLVETTATADYAKSTADTAKNKNDSQDNTLESHGKRLDNVEKNQARVGPPGPQGKPGAAGKDGVVNRLENADGEDLTEPTMRFGAGFKLTRETNRLLLEVEGGGGDDDTGGGLGGGAGGAIGGGGGLPLLGPSRWRGPDNLIQSSNGAIGETNGGWVDLVPFTFGRDGTISDLGFEITTSEGSEGAIRVVAYASDANHYPNSQVLNVVTIQQGTPHIVVIPCSIPVKAGVPVWIGSRTSSSVRPSKGRFGSHRSIGDTELLKAGGAYRLLAPFGTDVPLVAPPDMRAKNAEVTEAVIEVFYVRLAAS